MSAKWYVVSTQAQKEALALINLKKQGFETYLPRYKKTRRHARKVDTVLAPLFPGYAFVKIDLEQQRWRAIYSTKGVKTLISFNNTSPCALPEPFIEELKQHESASGLISQAAANPFKPGEQVQISSDNFANCLATFIAMKDEERATLLLEFMQRKVTIDVPVMNLKAA